jgi:hypothetical protein
MWPFKRSKDSDPALKVQRPDDWTLGQGERDGFPMIVRIANAYHGLAPLPQYEHHLIVSVRFRKPQSNGFPSSQEGDALESLEQNLYGLLEIDNDALCALVITNNGLRDFIYYTRNVEGTKNKLEHTRSIFKGFQVEFALEPARDWEIYKTFARMLNRPN